MTESPEELTQLLRGWQQGDRDAVERLMPLIYRELRKMAHRFLQRQPLEQTLETSALVHEVYLRFAGREPAGWRNRTHFYAVCAQVMRSLLIDSARARQSLKRGGGLRQVELDENVPAAARQEEQLLALDEALKKLAAFDQRMSRIVEMRYFGGMSMTEIAETLGFSEITIKREWLKARGWLYREISQNNI